MSSSPVRVLITGAAGQIAYSLIPLVASGQALGSAQPIDLVLYDIASAAKTMRGVAMEIDDCTYPLINSVTATTDAKKAFENVQIAILVGGFPRGPGMKRKDLLVKNKPIFVAAGQALNEFASPDCKVVVVANPANTNCAITARNAPNIPKANFTALTRLDMNRAVGQLAYKLGVRCTQVKKVTIWGNHSKTQVPDASSAVVIDQSGQQQPLVKKLNDDPYLQSEFMEIVQNRGAQVIEARGLSSAVSAANAIKDHLNSWLIGTAANEYVSMVVYTGAEGAASYGIGGDLFYSFPVTCKGGQYSIVTGLDLPDFIKAAMKFTEQELVEERSEAGLGN